jgi:hypothetical protein
MCCFFTTLFLLGPRFALGLWWIINPDLFSRAFDLILWPILGIIFLPWTTIMYLIVFPGGVNGLDWLWLGLGLFFDIFTHTGGAFGNRDRVRR